MTIREAGLEHLRISGKIVCELDDGVVDIAKAKEKARHTALAIKAAIADMRYSEARKETPSIPHMK